MISFRYSAVIALALIAQNLYAQPSRFEIGLTGGAMQAAHDASFTKLGDFASCCPEFSGARSIGPLLGAYIAVPLGTNLRLHARLLTANEGARMSFDEGSFVADLRDSARVVPAVFRHELTSTLTSFGLEPTLAWRPLGGLEVMAGARMAYMTAASFVQTETMIEPADFGSYLGTGRTWVNHNADIPGANSLRIGVLAALRYSLPLTRDTALVLAPELAYVHDVSGVAANVRWNVHQIRASLSIGWRPRPSTPSEPQRIPDPLPAPSPAPAPVRPPLTATIRAEGVLPDGTRTPQPTLRIEEVLISDLRPLLPYVYFDKGQSELPARYVQRTDVASFSEAGLYSVGTLETYYDLLNIIGRRLQDNPTAAITVTGHVTQTGADTGTALAKSRAETVKRYLTQRWNIAEQRISTVGRLLPDKPTRAVDPADAPLAEEENRRVEISSNQPEILAPVRTADTARSSNLASIAFTVDVPSGTTVTRWKIEAMQDGRRLFQAGSQGALPTSPIEWKLDADRSRMPSTDEPITYTVELDDINGSTFRSLPQDISVQQLTIRRKRTERIEDRERDRFSLILFDFNDASIKGQNADIIPLIRSKIRPESSVMIRGSADIIGAEAYNRTLARNRAQETAKILGVASRATLGTDIGTAAPFPVNLPEGRAYSRTVVVTVETPVR